MTKTMSEDVQTFYNMGHIIPRTSSCSTIPPFLKIYFPASVAAVVTLFSGFYARERTGFVCIYRI